MPYETVRSCVVRTTKRQLIETLAAELDVDQVGLWYENGQIDVVDADVPIDACPGNGRDDVADVILDTSGLDTALADNVRRQQTKLNELFSVYGLPPLTVDGISGSRTGQRLCAARAALGLEATTEDMQPGSTEQAVLYVTDELPAPDTTVLGANRWAVIELTCQMMFVGAGDDLEFVFATSTGSAGYETRQQDRSEVFRFNPASDNGGWHDSTEFPVGIDNPLNGNMFKPLYFDLGQAIHGANSVPSYPDSKGCARLSVSDHQELVNWLGLGDVQGELWRTDEIDFVVNVQGAFVARN